MPGAVRVAIELAVFRVRVALVKSAHLIRAFGRRRRSRLFGSHVGLCALSAGRPPEYPNGRSTSSSAGLGVGGLLHLAEHLVEVEAGGLLPLRKFPEGLQEFPDKRLRRH